MAFSKLEKHYGGRTLFADVSLQLNAGRCYGLVGANGSGKSTLMRILCGDEHATNGEVLLPKHARLGVLRQDQFLNDDERILDVAMGADPAFAAMRQKAALLAEGDGADGVERLAHLEEDIARLDGYTLPARAGAVLEGLGIAVDVHEQPLRVLSGGFKLRVLLGQVLVARPDVLLLDEPTNHLDILSIRWLERYLSSRAFTGCAVVISHDQRFLENVATDILDIDYGTITHYPGRYAWFEKEKALRRTQKEAELARVQAEIDHKRSFVERFGAKNTKATQAQSRLKQIEKLEEDLDELPPSSRRTPRFLFQQQQDSGKDVLELRGVDKSFGAGDAVKRVLSGVSLLIKKGERVAVIGRNGIGKSTLLKIATGSLAADAGSVRWGAGVVPGVFSQDHRDVLSNPDDTPLEFLMRRARDETLPAVRGALGRVLFSGDDVHKRVRALSGGEAARLVFADLMLARPNVLVLDEPTNHLDLEAIHALVAALLEYPGTLIFVSHDRWFVSQLATRVVELLPSGLRDFAGSYADYLQALGDDHLDGDTAALRANAEKAEEKDRRAAGASEAATSWEEQKRKKNERKLAEKRREQLLADLERQEAERDRIRARWTEDGFFTSTPQAEQDTLAARERTLSTSIDALVAEWEQLEAQLEQLGA